jgi:hypothetical protein
MLPEPPTDHNQGSNALPLLLALLLLLLLLLLLMPTAWWLPWLRSCM